MIRKYGIRIRFESVTEQLNKSRYSGTILALLLLRFQWPKEQL